jgi:glycosyltransferase involved in cell wall biosynthesis
MSTPAPPEVSVLMPYRDAAPNVGEAIGSVLAEEGVDLELLVIDDGSRDEGPALVDAIARRDPRVRHLRHTSTSGAGIVASLRLGCELARAPFIARMDSDDVSLPGRIRRALARLRADASLAAVGTRVEAFVTEGAGSAVGEGLVRYVAWQNALVTPQQHAHALFVESPLCNPSVTMRREAFDRVGGYRETSGPEDYDLFLRFDEAGFGLAKLEETLLRWRHRPERVTFNDPHCRIGRFAELKAPFLAGRLRSLGRPFAIWGAGKTGKRLARALELHDAWPTRFFDIDPRKLGRPSRSARIEPPEALRRGGDGAAAAETAETIVVALGEPGARDVVRARLDALGLIEGADYLCAS